MPQLTLFDSGGNVIATDSGWQNAPARGSSTVNASVSSATSAIFTLVGAFQFAPNSADSALVASLPPGAYTAQVIGPNNATGQALVEVYEVPQTGGGSTGGQAPVITVQPVSQTVSSGGSFTLTVTVSASGSVTYQWYLNGVAIPGATGSTYAGSTPGSYSVVVSNAYGSVTSSTATITGGGGPTPTPTPGGGGSLTGTWTGTWEEDNAGGGFCGDEIWNVTWVLVQSGTNVSGSYSESVGSEDGFCPDGVGAKMSGTISGTVSGSTFTLVTDGGAFFTGALSGGALNGIGSNNGPNAMEGSISTGPFGPFY
jgi:hypothetical protein